MFGRLFRSGFVDIAEVTPLADGKLLTVDAHGHWCESHEDRELSRSELCVLCFITHDAQRRVFVDRAVKLPGEDTVCTMPLLRRALWRGPRWITDRVPLDGGGRIHVGPHGTWFHEEELRAILHGDEIPWRTPVPTIAGDAANLDAELAALRAWHTPPFHFGDVPSRREEKVVEVESDARTAQQMEEDVLRSIRTNLRPRYRLPGLAVAVKDANWGTGLNLRLVHRRIALPDDELAAYLAILTEGLIELRRQERASVRVVFPEAEKDRVQSLVRPYP